MRETPRRAKEQNATPAAQQRAPAPDAAPVPPAATAARAVDPAVFEVKELYTTAKGKKCHIFDDCPHIKKSKFSTPCTLSL